MGRSASWRQHGVAVLSRPFRLLWEYTYSTESSPNLGLKIEGEFPDSRFLSYNVYDDDEQSSNCEKPYSIMDVDIVPDEGSSNPFLGSTSDNKKYTVYVLPVDAPSSITAGKKNIIWYDSDVKKVCTILRYYIPEGGIEGGIKMPMISGINLKDGSLVPAPKRELSGLRGEMTIPGGAFSSQANMLFFRAPFSFAYPNGPAEYCYNRNVLEQDNVMVFNFKAPSASLREPRESTMFGLPFSHKPLRVVGKYRYKSGGSTLDSGMEDKCRILAVMYLTDEKVKHLNGFNIRTSPNIVGMAEIADGSSTQGEGYHVFDISFRYDKVVDPELLAKGRYNLALVFSSSNRGDVYDGAPGSELLIDDVEIICE